MMMKVKKRYQLLSFGKLVVSFLSLASLIILSNCIVKIGEIAEALKTKSQIDSNIDNIIENKTTKGNDYFDQDEHIGNNYMIQVVSNKKALPQTTSRQQRQQQQQQVNSSIDTDDENNHEFSASRNNSKLSSQVLPTKINKFIKNLQETRDSSFGRKVEKYASTATTSSGESKDKTNNDDYDSKQNKNITSEEDNFDDSTTNNETLDEPKLEVMSCDETRFSATIVLPKSFVSTPKFNDDSYSLSSCSISRLKYRLYPTFTLSANPWRSCGAVELNATTGDDEKNNDHNDNINSMTKTDASIKNPDRQQQVTRISYHKILAITIRFPMIEKLRTIEDKYATLICSFVQTTNINEKKNLNLQNEAEVKFKDAISVVDKTLKWSRRSGPSEWWTATPLTITTQTTKFTDNANESRNSNLLIEPIKDTGNNIRRSDKLRDVNESSNNKTIINSQLRYSKPRVYNEPIKVTIGSPSSSDKRIDEEEIVDGTINNEDNANDVGYDDDNEVTYTRDKDDNLSKESLDRSTEQQNTNKDNDDNGDYSLEDKQPMSILHANGSLVSDLSSWLALRRRKEFESLTAENESKNTHMTTSSNAEMNNDNNTRESSDKYNKTNLHENHRSNHQRIIIERQATNNNNINLTMLAESTSLVPLFVSSSFENHRSTTTSKPTTTTNMTTSVVVDELKDIYQNSKLHLIDSSFDNLTSTSEERSKLKVSKVTTKVGSSLNGTSTTKQELESVDDKLKLMQQKRQQQQRYHQTTTTRHLSPTFNNSETSVLLSICLIGTISIALVLLAFSVLLANLAS